MALVKRSVSVVRIPALARARGAVRRFASRHPRVAKVASAAADQRHLIAASGAGYALGYLSRKDKDGKSFVQRLPRIDAIGVPGTLALAAWGVGKFTNSRIARHMCTGFAAIAAYRAGVGKDKDGKPNDVIEGDDDDGETSSGKY